MQLNATTKGNRSRCTTISTIKVSGGYAGTDVCMACNVFLFSSAGEQGPLVGYLGAGGSVSNH